MRLGVLIAGLALILVGIFVTMGNTSAGMLISIVGSLLVVSSFVIKSKVRGK